MPPSASEGEQIFKGIPVSGGVCRGKIIVLAKTSHVVTQIEVSEQELPNQIKRLDQALFETRQQLLEVQKKVSVSIGTDDASIFDAHLLVLDDHTLIDEVSRLIQKKQCNAEYAFHEVAERYAKTLSAVEDDYLRERATDMRDVTTRILNNLMGHKERLDVHHLKEKCIIISDDLAPSTTAFLDKEMVLGFATDVGSRTSHTAIMARSLEIPAVVGLKNASDKLKTGQEVLLDGYNGIVIVNPTEQTLYEYGQLIQKQDSLQELLRGLKNEPAVTMDGCKIILSANIEQASDTTAVLAHGAQGVGLFRTEYLYIDSTELPTEDEQFEAYKQVAETLKPEPVVIRTLDLGGDKFISPLKVPHEMNPFLGWRAIRYCLEEHDIFRAQLRAILRASVYGNVKVMYPMISCLDEIERANLMVESYKDELRRENVPFDENLEIGIMVEIPSAAIAADSLARKVKFFSIGTNDLIQYSLAVDRLNEKIAHLYQPTHPAIIRLIKMTVDAAHKNNIWTGVCGEMAGDPALVPLLLGLGVDELSVAPSMVPTIKYLIRHLRMPDARALADFALNCESSKEILARSEALAHQIAPSLFENQV